MLKSLLPAVAALTAMLLSYSGLQAEEEARLLRFPTISQDAIVFSYGGDLYRVDRNGGEARRLTSHKGY